MAVMRRGIIGDVSGRLGGVEFAVTKGRSVVKSCKVKRSRVSERTYDARAIQAEAVKHWEGFTDSQRLAWDIASKEHPIPDRFGIPRVRSGRELFLSVPHDWRFSSIVNWQEYPPTRSIGWVSEPVVLTFTSTSFIATLIPEGPASQWYAFAWFARFTKAYRRQHRGWFKGGGVMYNKGIEDCDFSSSMAGFNVAFVSGEQVAVKVQVWHENYWPTWWDFGVLTCP